MDENCVLPESITEAMAATRRIGGSGSLPANALAREAVEVAQQLIDNMPDGPKAETKKATLKDAIKILTGDAQAQVRGTNLDQS